MNYVRDVTGIHAKEKPVSQVAGYQISRESFDSAGAIHRSKFREQNVNRVKLSRLSNPVHTKALNKDTERKFELSCRLYTCNGRKGLFSMKKEYFLFIFSLSCLRNSRHRIEGGIDDYKISHQALLC